MTLCALKRLHNDLAIRNKFAKAIFDLRVCGWNCQYYEEVTIGGLLYFLLLFPITSNIWFIDFYQIVLNDINIVNDSSNMTEANEGNL